MLIAPEIYNKYLRNPETKTATKPLTLNGQNQQDNPNLILQKTICDMFSNKPEERLIKCRVLIGVVHNHLLILTEDWELWSFKT
jgi:hypothetical protein